MRLGQNGVSIKFKAIKNSKSLQILHLNGTGSSASFEGTSNFVSLSLLNLSSSKFTGSTPKESYNIDKLESLSTQRDAFAGTISSGIGRLKNLKQFDASSDEVEGVLTVTMEFCTQL